MDKDLNLWQRAMDLAATVPPPEQDRLARLRSSDPEFRAMNPDERQSRVVDAFGALIREMESTVIQTGCKTVLDQGTELYHHGMMAIRADIQGILGRAAASPDQVGRMISVAKASGVEGAILALATADEKIDMLTHLAALSQLLASYALLIEQQRTIADLQAEVAQLKADRNADPDPPQIDW